RSRGADAVAVQKDHDFTHGLLFGPGRENASRANRPDTVDLAQPTWFGLDDFEHLLAKGANEFFGVDRSHAPTNTMGMVVVAAFAANAAGGANAAIRSTRLPTRSAANAGSRSYWPSAMRAPTVTSRPAT